MTLPWVHDCFMARAIKCPSHDEWKLIVSKWNQTQQRNAQCKHIPSESVNVWKWMRIILKLPKFYWKQLENKQGFKHQSLSKDAIVLKSQGSKSHGLNVPQTTIIKQ